MAFSAMDKVVGWLEKVDQSAAGKAAAGEGAISILKVSRRVTQGPLSGPLWVADLRTIE